MTNIIFDVVIQGPFSDITDEVIKRWASMDFVENVIYSTWNYNKNIIFNNFGKKVKTIYNDDVDFPGITNTNRDIFSTFEGLKKTTSSYIIKSRDDMLWTESCLNSCFEFFKKYHDLNRCIKLDGTIPKSRILCCGLYTQWPFGYDHKWSYGVTNFMNWSTREELIQYYDIPFYYDQQIGRWGDYTRQLRSESYIGSHYYSKFDERIKYFVNNKDEGLYDCRKFSNEAYDLYLKYSTKICKPFPESVLKDGLYWPKKYKDGMWDMTECKNMFGTIYHENDPYETS